MSFKRLEVSNINKHIDKVFIKYMKQCQMKQYTAHLSKNVELSSKLIIINFLASATYVTSLH